MAQKKLIERIIDGLQDLSTLEVKTIIGEFTEDPATKKITGTPKKSNIIRTQINLVDADITTAMSDVFRTEPYSEIREYHESKVEQSQDIMKGNIEAMKSLLELLIDALKKKDENPELTQ